jgi:magnesium transporter
VSTRVFACRKGSTTLLEPTADQLPTLFEDPDVMLWVDVEGATKEEEQMLIEVFGLHPLLVEDMLGETQPKLEEHDDHYYLIVHGLDLDHHSPTDLRTVEIDVILAEGFVLTHHDRAVASVEFVIKRVRRDPRLMHQSPAFLAHAIIDHEVDRYLPLMGAYDYEIGDLELEIMKETRPKGVLERIFDLKHSLQRIRRVAIHQTDVLLRLSNGTMGRIPEEALPFYRDVYDHFVRVNDLTDSYRDLVSSSLDAFLSVQSNRMNEVMKVLTLISTIMLPLTFIAGLYGMNFDHMPELHWDYGYAFSWALMLVTAIGFVIFFRRRGWL